MIDHGPTPEMVIQFLEVCAGFSLVAAFWLAVVWWGLAIFRNSLGEGGHERESHDE